MVDSFFPSISCAFDMSLSKNSNYAKILQSRAQRVCMWCQQRRLIIAFKKRKTGTMSPIQTLARIFFPNQLLLNTESNYYMQKKTRYPHWNVLYQNATVCQCRLTFFFECGKWQKARQEQRKVDRSIKLLVVHIIYTL